MSLINDALKRAKESHGENPPPPAAPPEKTGLRPVESAPRRGMPVWLWPLIIIILVGLGMFLIGQSTHKPVAANSNAAAEPTQPSKVEPAPPAPVVVAKAPAPQPVKPAVATPAAVVETNTTQAPVQVAAVPAVPAAPTYKLQSIIYDPRRPSAMVNGKSLFVGDRINGFHVLAIGKNSITLVGNGQTNVLELEN